MAEVLTPTAGPVAPPYSFVRLVLDLEAQKIEAVVRQNPDGGLFYGMWTGATAVTLLTALNTANLSTASLVKRLLLKMSTDGFIPAGTVSGVPN